jgi:hypothetical protein
MTEIDIHISDLVRALAMRFILFSEPLAKQCCSTRCLLDLAKHYRVVDSPPGFSNSSIFVDLVLEPLVGLARLQTRLAGLLLALIDHFCQPTHQILQVVIFLRI